MVKQKIVIKVTMKDAKKQSKALQTAVGLLGITKAEVGGADRDRIMVVGDGIDSVKLTKLLRKKMGFAELVSVGPAEGEKKEGKKEEKKEDKSKNVMPMVWPSQQPYVYSYELPNYNKSSWLM